MSVFSFQPICWIRNVYSSQGGVIRHNPREHYGEITMVSGSHTYSVALRIEGPDVNPSEISAELGLASSYSRERGEPRGNSGNFEEGLWSYDGTSNSKEWSTLEEGLLDVMGDLLPHLDLIKSYIVDRKVYWWCGHFQTSFNGGPEFSADLFKKLDYFGIPLMLDNYFPDPREESEI